MVAKQGLPRSIKWAGYLAILFGIAGVLAGLAGAGTFIPFQSESTFNPQSAEMLTIIALVGTAISVLGVFSGWELLRTKGWAWGAALGAALGSVGSVAAMAAVWPESAPFVGVVAFFYAIEVILLLAGSAFVRSRRVSSAPA